MFSFTQEHSNQEMDLEELIAPSKVSKHSNQSDGAQTSANSCEKESSSTASNEKDDMKRSSESKSSNDQLQQQQQQPQQEESTLRSGRRTRSKRPRSGEDFEQLVLPERKRELRSSASRLARLAEEKMASKMQSASSNESINE